MGAGAAAGIGLSWNRQLGLKYHFVRLNNLQADWQAFQSLLPDKMI